MSDLRDRFHRDGVVCVHGVLDANSQRLVSEAFNARYSNLTSNVLNMSPAKGGTFITDLTSPSFWKSKEFSELLSSSPIVDVALECCGGNNLWFYYEQIFWKEGESRRTPWHQDSSYLPVGGKNMARAWITLDEIPPASRLEFVRGSHLGPLYNASQWREDDPTVGVYPEGMFVELPDIEANRTAFDIVSFDCSPSDILLFHPGTLHGGGKTFGDDRRRTMSFMFFGDDAYLEERPMVDNAELVGSFEKERISNLKNGDPFRPRDAIKVR